MPQTMLYHMVPPNMEGTMIHPASALDENLAAKAEEKYEGREDANDYHIDLLNCRRQDVVFLMTIHPEVLHKVFADNGPTPQFRFFEIPLDRFNQSKLCFYYPSSGQRPTEKNFTPFDESECISEPSEALRDHIIKERAEGRRPLLAAHTQQVIYKGSINTDGLRVIEVG